ncbi:M15 family metallopeptidase [Methylocystis heyeri]|uniref:Peptidase M15C domain-containing protein n=1 Tax=Methylocystis heyeri TaxID=391905 RepID=A0A6B8KJF5_9HYPH|nr:M15 family metallopeptidase [Methylocystis heyeri]QGM46718.1 hypothetical protein H2LOC_014015 [Methylocystis heyeri]
MAKAPVQKPVAKPIAKPAAPAIPPSRPLQSECLKLFGNPSRPQFGVHIEHVQPPWQMRMGDLDIHFLKVNRCAAPSLELVLKDIWESCGKSQAKIEALHIDRFSGDWVVRQMRGGSMTSMHAYALALDFDAGENQLGQHHGFFKSVSLIVQCFEKHGWIWGGRWEDRPDPMHFQFATVD